MQLSELKKKKKYIYIYRDSAKGGPHRQSNGALVRRGHVDRGKSQESSKRWKGRRETHDSHVASLLDRFAS